MGWLKPISSHPRIGAEINPTQTTVPMMGERCGEGCSPLNNTWGLLSGEEMSTTAVTLSCCPPIQEFPFIIPSRMVSYAFSTSSLFQQTILRCWCSGLLLHCYSYNDRMVECGESLIWQVVVSDHSRMKGSSNEFEKQLESSAHTHKVESPGTLNLSLENLIAYKRRKVNIQI